MISEYFIRGRPAEDMAIHLSQIDNLKMPTDVPMNLAALLKETGDLLGCDLSAVLSTVVLVVSGQREISS